MRARHGLSHVRWSQVRLSRARVPMLSGAAVTWLPVLVGIGVVAGFMIYGITSRAGVDWSAADAPVGTGGAFEDRLPRLPGTPGPEVSAEPTGPPATPAPTDPPPTDPPPAGAQTTEPLPPAHPAPPQPDVAGSYRVEESFPHEFTGRVLITNTAGRARDWTVELAFPPDVGELREFWVDGTTQPAVRDSGGRYIFTSGAPVGAGGQVVLKVQFVRSGADVDPVVCAVDGAPCGLA